LHQREDKGENVGKNTELDKFYSSPNIWMRKSWKIWAVHVARMGQMRSPQKILEDQKGRD